MLLQVLVVLSDIRLDVVHALHGWPMNGGQERSVPHVGSR